MNSIIIIIKILVAMQEILVNLPEVDFKRYYVISAVIREKVGVDYFIDSYLMLLGEVN